MAAVVVLAWLMLAGWFSVRFQPLRIDFAGAVAEWMVAGWVPLTIWGSFAVAALIDWRARGGPHQVQGALVAIAIRTGGTACLVLAIVLTGAAGELRNQRLIAIAVVYVIALMVDTLLWLRQVKQASPDWKVET